MARINVDDKWFSVDPRRKKWVKAVGDEYMADGLALHFWRLGQEAFAKGRGINKKMFDLMPFSKQFIECELAEVQDGGIYIKGSKRSDWYKLRVQAAQKGGAQKSTRKAQAAKEREERKKLRRAAPLENTEESTSKSTKAQAKAQKHNPHVHVHVHSHVQDQIQFQDQIQNQEGENDAAAKSPPPPPAGSKLHFLIEIWNEHCGVLAKVKHSNTQRDRKISVLWKQQERIGWIETVQKIAASNFCCGKNDRGWKASFDWLLQPDTWLKVVEGKYDNNRSALSTNQSRKYDNLEALEKKWSEAPK